MRKPLEGHLYTPKHAEIYATLGITDTTYEIGFAEVARLLGDVNGTTFLDFGCGAGRSSAFLRSLGVAQVYGVDHDHNMIAAANSHSIIGLEFVLIDNYIPLPDNSMDGAISTSVFVELRTLEQMQRVCADIARVLKPRGLFVIMSTSPLAFTKCFKSFRYSACPPLNSGSIVNCTISCNQGEFTIQDTYWQESDYRTVLGASGLAVEEVTYPTAVNNTLWKTDEVDTAPFIVIKSTKSFPSKGLK